MNTLRTDVIGIGNAIVDVIARTEDDFLVRHGMRKGTMALIDEARAGAIYDAMGPAASLPTTSGRRASASRPRRPRPGRRRGVATCW
jgi:hypothetical protein